MNSYELFTFKLTTLTPLHIGSGVELLNEYDYTIHGGQTWRLNDTAILESQMPKDDPEVADRLALIPPGKLLTDKDFDTSNPNQFFRYILNGKPRSEIEGAQFREQIKNFHDEPYIPGSSVKGALRTSIASYGWGKKKLTASIEDIYETTRGGAEKLKQAKFVGQTYERKLFVGENAPRGKEPNHDLFRALQVSDSNSISTNQLMVLNAQVFKHDGEPGTPIEVEAIQPNTTLEMIVKIDSTLFSDWAKKQGLKLPNSAWFGDIARIVNERSSSRAQAEINWLGELTGTKRIASFYKKEILDRNLKQNQFLLQLGWGTGWENMTFGSRLQAEEDFMETIIAEYKMSMNKERQVGDLFPESRRMAIKVVEEDSIALMHPLGWVLVETIKK